MNSKPFSFNTKQYIFRAEQIKTAPGRSGRSFCILPNIYFLTRYLRISSEQAARMMAPLMIY